MPTPLNKQLTENEMVEVVYDRLKAREFLEALDAIQDCLEQYPNSKAARHVLSEKLPFVPGLLLASSEFAHAMENYAKSKQAFAFIRDNQELNDEMRSVLCKRAWWLYIFGKNKKEGAFAIYNQVISSNPNDVEALCGIGKYWFDKKEWIQAGKYFEAALEKKPEDKTIAQSLRDALRELGQYEKSKILAQQLDLSQQRWEKIISNLCDVSEEKSMPKKLAPFSAYHPRDPELILSALVEFFEENPKKNLAAYIQKIQLIPELVCYIAGNLPKKHHQENVIRIKPEAFVAVLKEICPPSKVMRAFRTRRNVPSETIAEKESKDLIIELYDSAMSYEREKGSAFVSLDKSGMTRGNILIRQLGRIVIHPALKDPTLQKPDNMNLIVDTLSEFLKEHPGGKSLYTEIFTKLFTSESFMACLKKRGMAPKSAQEIGTSLITMPTQAQTAPTLPAETKSAAPELIRTASEQYFFKPDTLYLGSNPTQQPHPPIAKTPSRSRSSSKGD